MAYAPLNDIKVPISTNRYEPQAIDEYWGSTFDIDLFKVDEAISYMITVTLGSLTGGTSPAWNVSGNNPVIAHVRVVYDNDVVYDSDVQLVQEYNKITKGYSPNGLQFVIDIADINLKTKKYFIQTGYPTWSVAQAKMYITLPALTSVTTGTPTGSSGTELYMTERVVRRSLVTWPLLEVKHLQTESSMPLSGANHLVNYLARVGAYKAVLFFASTAQNYSSGSDSLINYMELKLNKKVTVFDEYFASLKLENLSEFNVSPDAGFALKTFMKDDNIPDMLYLGNTQQITEVDLDVNTSQAGGYLYALQIQYI